MQVPASYVTNREHVWNRYESSVWRTVFNLMSFEAKVSMRLTLFPGCRNLSRVVLKVVSLNPRPSYLFKHS